ncbi:MAG: xylulokinase [Promethearchaeota archaeon]
MQYIMALDLGTTGIRSVLFDVKGSIIEYSYEEWESIYPSPTEVEQDANVWWDATRRTVEAVLKKTKINPADIISLSVTNQRETIVPVDENGVPLANAIVWQDRRTLEECKFILDRVPKDVIYKTTGLTVDPYFSSSKILWFKNNRPEIYDKAKKFLLVHDFIVKKLTGRFITDESNASRTMLFDINKKRWSESIITELGLDADKLPDVMASGSLIGTISPDSGISLYPRTKVIVGAGDQQCAALGVGVNKPGRVKCTMGTGTFLIAYSDKIKLDDKMRVLCSCGAIPGTYVVEASMFSTGSFLRWARDCIGKSEVLEAEAKACSAYKLIDELASSSKIGAEKLLALPYIVGAGAPFWNPDARGVIFGLAAGHQRKDIYRAIMEAAAFDIKRNLAVFAELGLEPNELRLTGGGSRSDIWNQIIADACAIPCIKPRYEEATAVGAAILAAIGSGLFKDIYQAEKVFIDIESRYLPDHSKSEKYRKVIELSEKLYTLLDESGIFQDLRELDI